MADAINVLKNLISLCFLFSFAKLLHSNRKNNTQITVTFSYFTENAFSHYKDMATLSKLFHFFRQHEKMASKDDIYSAQPNQVIFA
jgi:hypothetical protein